MALGLSRHSTDQRAMITFLTCSHEGVFALMHTYRLLASPLGDHFIGTQLGDLLRGETCVGQDGLGMLPGL